MRLEQLRYLLEIAQCKSLTEAGEHLHMSQQGLNNSIFKMEEELGVKILFRNNRGIQLTEAGKIFARGANKLLTEYQELVATVQNPQFTSQDKERRILIGATYGVLEAYFSNLLAKFYNEEPTLQLLITEMTQDDIIERLEQKMLDFGLVQYSTIDEPYWQDDTRFTFIPLYRSKMYIRVSTKHPLAQYDSISLKSAVKEKVLIYQPSAWGSDVNPICHLIEHFYPECHISFENNYQLHHEKLLQGLGIAFSMSNPNESMRDHPGLKYIPLKDDIETVHGFLLRNEEIPPTIQYVLNYFRILLNNR